MKRLTLLAASAVLAGSAFAHHGWSEYQADKPLELAGTIEQAGYEQPHGYVRLKTATKTWLVVLAPPSRMESRGLPSNKLVAGQKAAVYGYPHRSKGDELRAERITIEGKTTELR
ncbi:DUF6152 family protein [Massilia sp. GCM10023247]|uniref:DUF6152 family protein n=1 Tax=Massilia sp. GCM10023247 TaxID=3252643 RepID=UPI00362320BD